MAYATSSNPNPVSVALRGSVTSNKTPATAPISEKGAIHLSSVMSASRENRLPRASEASTSSSTHSGSTNSSAKKCDNTEVVNKAAPNTVTPKMTYAPKVTAAATMNV